MKNKISYFTKEQLLNNHEIEHKEVPGFPRYIINELGEVFIYLLTRICKKDLWRKIKRGYKKDYIRIILTNEGITRATYVHILIAENFIGPCPQGMEVCHNNSDIRDNRKTNLRWDTHKNNMADKIENGTRQNGENNGNSKLTESQVIEIKHMIKNKRRPIDIARKFNVTSSLICRIKRGLCWPHITIE